MGLTGRYTSTFVRINDRNRLFGSECLGWNKCRGSFYAMCKTNSDKGRIRYINYISQIDDIGEIDPSSPHSGIQYGDTPAYSNPPSLFGTSPGTLMATVNGHGPRGKIRLGARQRRDTSNSVLGEWGEVFSSNRRGGCCSS
jgi:hypothetical protein